MIHVLTFVIFLLNALPGGGDDRLQPCDEGHALLHGHVVEIQYGSELHGVAPDVLAAVYRNGELFSAFRSDRKGDFFFNLPVGWEYVIIFGGNHFVNRTMRIDLSELAAGECREPTVYQEISLFKPVEGVDYNELDEAPVVWAFQKTSMRIEQDLNTLFEMLKVESRLFKKSERVALKRTDNN